MQDRPAGVEDGDVQRALVEGWDIDVGSVDYAAVGFGSYHWVVADKHQQRFFVTVDDLNHKNWLGDTCDAVFVGLRTAFDVASALRDRGGLRFVLAPLPTTSGESVWRIGACHSVALFPFVDGEAGDFGDVTSSAHRADVVRLLVELHRSTPTAAPTARTLDLQFAGRSGLEAALRALDRGWHSGPFGEPARAWLAGHVDDVGRLLTDYDRLLREVTAASLSPVITHGEPHPGNVMRGPDGLVLIDWDTVGLAPPERDLWLIATASGEETALYADATGHEVSTTALSLYRVAWELTDIANYIDQLRSPHDDSPDNASAWLYLQGAAGGGAACP